MSDELATLTVYAGQFGLYSSIVGLAVMLLMPERVGHRSGGILAILGGIAMGYEVVALRVIM